MAEKNHDLGELPPGWLLCRRYPKEFRWSCPLGFQCASKGRILYKKATSKEAVQQGVYHLCNPEFHSSPTYSLEQAQAKAPEGLTEGVKEEWYAIDSLGQEQDPPEQVVANQPSRERSRSRRRSRRRHARSRTPASANPEQNQSSGSRDSQQLSVGIQVLRPDLRPAREVPKAIVTAASFTNQLTTSNSVKISPIELDHLIDCTERNAATLEHMAAVCRSTAPMFENAARQITDCKHFFERMKRY